MPAHAYMNIEKIINGKDSLYKACWGIHCITTTFVPMCQISSFAILGRREFLNSLLTTGKRAP
jgi:hypothetical protein